MFGLGFGEVTVILLLALIFLGPKRLPEVGKKLGEFYRQFRDTAETVRSSIKDDFEEPSITVKDNISKVSSSESKVPSPESRVPGPEIKVLGPLSKDKSHDGKD